LTLDAPKNEEGSTVAFHALAPDLKTAPATTVPLFEYRIDDASRCAYFTEDSSSGRAGWQRSSKGPLCRVWKNPYRPAK
jgi:hypothetical protein